ncbi:hypothetical protein AMJ44_07040 [candidate division WOR-1 bacterium DG_54_3]|uniref:Uncharacterized protein n=1 Tax=candidate division WOR-1 bacterium DG_54_3 TaxID=1703775 RepID=A0A0S7XZL2_UNCSA|nr:MAG: hypothetical protein AMJ44_07040 [candidate division WOR-1 bacterium DG_54_3]
MKITFVYPDTYPDYPKWPGGFYFGIASLSSILKGEGHQTSLIHITQPINKYDFIKRIRSDDPDLIGFSSTSHHARFVKELASWLVEAKVEVPTIYGGIHPTIVAEESIAMDGIDMICRGEGEAALAELCHRIEKKQDTKDIENLWVKTDGKITRNPIRPLLDDLDRLPFPDRSIFNYSNLLDEREGVAVFLASKGCPYSCTYCTNHLLRKIYGKGSKTVRFRSVDNVIAEIKQVLYNYPHINSIIFHDDILLLKRTWAEEFTEKYRSEINIPFICNARADVTDEAVVNLLKKAGCSHVKFGIESGNAEIRSRVLNRHMTNDQIKKAFALCRKAGLMTLSFNMVGIPYETPDTILDTIKLNASIGVNYIQATIYQPYQGTKLNELCREQNFYGSEGLGPSFYSPTVLKLNTLSPTQILMFKENFRALTRYYQVLQKLPTVLSHIAIRFSDKILSFNLTAHVLNLIHVPLNYLYLRCIQLKVKSKIAHLQASNQKHLITLKGGHSEGKT